jgi:hypothetical protein
VDIAIYDAGGGLVNRFSSADPVTPPDLAKIAVAPEWLPQPHPPGLAPGQHRFVWNLRYAGPVVGGGAAPAFAGVWAPPGRYAVEVSIDGKVLKGAVEVRADPRTRATPADLAAEFALARRIEAARVEARAALAEAGRQRARLEALAASDRPRAEALIARLDALADIPVESLANTPAARPPSVNGLPNVSARLDALAGAVDGADAPPSPDALSGFAQATATLDADLAALRAIAAS